MRVIVDENLKRRFGEGKVIDVKPFEEMEGNWSPGTRNGASRRETAYVEIASPNKA
jgi:hypothetical protein